MKRRTLLAGLALPALLSRPAAAADTMKVAVGQRGAWDTSVCAFGDRMGFFKDAGLTLDLLFTDGGAETQQAVISGGVDVGVGAGTLALLGAVARNAPLRIISSNFRGADDLFWYAKAGSGIASFKDAAGKSVAWSTTGSSTNLVAVRMMRIAGITDYRGVPTGSPAATLVQVLSGQIDIGYSLPPIAFADMEAGQVVMVGRGNDVPEFVGQTVRCLISTPAFADERREQAVRFLQAYHRTIDWMYADDRALTWFQEGANATPAQALRARTDFYPKAAMRLGRPGKLDLSMQQAIDLKRMPRPLSPEQQAKLIPPIWEPPA